MRKWAEYLAAWGVLHSLEWLPLPVAHRVARVYTRLFLDLAIPRLRRTGYRNLELALPELDAAQRRATIDGVFRSIARIIVCFAKFPSIRADNMGRWIRCEGALHFENARRSGRGVLFATAHLGNWELSAFAHALLTGPMNVVVRPLDNPRIDRMVEHRRALSGNRVIAKKDAARGILRALKNNEAVGILVDQNTVLAEGAFIDFFGIPACTNTAFAKLAEHSGATVIPGFALWSETDQRYTLRFYPPIPITGDPVADTQALHKQIEAVIRQYPDQWLWIHRRWKTRPAGRPSLY